MVLTVTLNPMLDKTIHVSSIRKGEIERASAMKMVVGGKGVNVSRQLHRWDHPTRATGFFGGEIGTLLERLLTEEGIEHNFVRIEAMTREGLTFLDADNVMTCIFEPPAKPTQLESDRLVTHALGLAQKCAWVVCSGSSPGTEADMVFQRIVQGCASLGVKSVVDSYGVVSRLAWDAKPTIMKMNREEYERTFGGRLADEADVIAAVAGFVSGGSAWGIITDGSRPFYVSNGAGMWRVSPPEIVSLNPTGSGDSAVAGLLFGFAQGWPVERVLAFGASAGAMNASHWSVANCSLDDVLGLVPSAVIEKL